MEANRKGAHATAKQTQAAKNFDLPFVGRERVALRMECNCSGVVSGETRGKPKGMPLHLRPHVNQYPPKPVLIESVVETTTAEPATIAPMFVIMVMSPGTLHLTHWYRQVKSLFVNQPVPLSPKELAIDTNSFCGHP
jgi:hypothetical protein